MKSKKEQTLPIAELLPEGLSEAAVSEIALLVNTVISEQVEEKTRQLEAKVKGFMRLRVDELKEQALRELREDEDFIRNASLFESVKTLMALELSKDDEDSAISELVREQQEFETEVEVLTEELRKSFEETAKAEAQFKVLSQKVVKLEEDKATLLEAVDTLEESTDQPFKSSEKAVIITENVDEKPKKSNEILDNDFLTPEVMKFMPSNPNS
jgi:Rad3-related DNA helicase